MGIPEIERKVIVAFGAASVLKSCGSLFCVTAAIHLAVRLAKKSLHETCVFVKASRPCQDRTRAGHESGVVVRVKKIQPQTKPKPSTQQRPG